MKATIIITLSANRTTMVRVEVVRGRRRTLLWRGIVHHEYHDNEMRRSMAETVHSVRPNTTPITCQPLRLRGWWADANNPLNNLFIFNI